jgi:hypothetical protein
MREHPPQTFGNQRRRRKVMRAGKIVAIVVGVLLVLIGLGLLAPGGFLLTVYGTMRDSSGFFETSSRVVSSTGHALVTPDVDLNLGPGPGWVPTGARAAVRIRAISDESTPIFIGIGPTDQVSQYFNGVAYDEVTDFGWWSANVKYEYFDGGAPSSPPGTQSFWVAQQEGPGSQTLDWEVQSGNWTAVVMNADAGAPVRANVSLGARFGLLLPIGIGLTVAGVVLLAVGILLIVLGARRPKPPLATQPTAAGPGPAPTAYEPPPTAPGSPPTSYQPPPTAPGPPPASGPPPTTTGAPPTTTGAPPTTTVAPPPSAPEQSPPAQGPAPQS